MSILKELRIPHMGSVENAKLVSWRIPAGASYKEGDVLYEIETDKTVTEVAAEGSGILASHVAAEGAELKVGDLVGWTAASGASPGEIARAISDAGAPKATGGEALRVSPRARRLAKEHGVELSLIASTDGRIRGEDIVRSMSAGVKSQETASTANLGAQALPGYEDVPVDVVPNSTRRRTIARRLTESMRTAPQLTADMQVDLTALMAARAELNTRLPKVGRPKVSVLSYVAYAAVRLLLEHRELNSAFMDSQTLVWKVVNLGIAVDAPDGLVVPVIRDAASLSLEEINIAIATFADRARKGDLSQQDLEGCTFTISNPGALGPVLRAEAILNPPQVALLGLPGIQYTPLALEAQDYRVEVRPVLRPSLTFDHRALDGGQVIRFLNALRAALENPEPA